MTPTRLYTLANAGMVRYITTNQKREAAQQRQGWRLCCCCSVFMMNLSAKEQFFYFCCFLSAEQDFGFTLCCQHACTLLVQVLVVKPHFCTLLQMMLNRLSRCLLASQPVLVPWSVAGCPAAWTWKTCYTSLLQQCHGMKAAHKGKKNMSLISQHSDTLSTHPTHSPIFVTEPQE